MITKTAYYRVKNGRGFWEPTPKMKAAGFCSVICGPDGPAARAIAEAWNARWQDWRRDHADDAGPGSDGFVYFLRVGSRIKIGFSRNPFKRVAGLKTSIPGRIDGFATVPGSRIDEAKLHQQLSHFRTEGEWFSASAPVVKAMTEALTKREQKFERLAGHSLNGERDGPQSLDFIGAP